MSIVSLATSSTDDVVIVKVACGIFSSRPSFEIASSGGSNVGTLAYIGIDSLKKPESRVDLSPFDVTGGGLEIMAA